MQRFLRTLKEVDFTERTKLDKAFLILKGRRTVGEECWRHMSTIYDYASKKTGSVEAKPITTLPPER